MTTYEEKDSLFPQTVDVLVNDESNALSLVIKVVLNELMFVYSYSCHPSSHSPVKLTPSIIKSSSGPANEILTCQLKLTNSSDRRVCFKVKTTAPKRYCVRPNNGIVEGRSTQTILVMLQPADWDTAHAADKSKHKFMVQTAYAPVDVDSLDLDAIWKTTPPEAISDFKLKCLFDHTTNASPASAPTASPPSSGHVFNHESGRSSDQTGDATKSGQDLEALSSQLTSNVSSSTHVSTTYDEKDKLLDENKKLRADVRKLRTEIMQMKEDGLKQRTRMSGGSSAATSADLLAQQKLSGQDSSLAPQEILQLLTNPNVLAVGIVLFIFGLLVGKVLF